MKRNYLKFIVVLVVFAILQGCTKSNQCECNTPFVLGSYYSSGAIVSNNNACWMLRTDAGPGGYINNPSNSPRDTFPTTQDYWIKICEK